MPRRFYIAGDGTKYPLIEAQTPFSIDVHRADCRKAITGDPANCLIALGARRHRNVDAAYIGSSKDAYVIMRYGRSIKAVAVHYTINARTSALRDAFDTNSKLLIQTVTLSPPSPGVTLAHRAKLGKRRREEVKNGALQKKRGPQKTSRVVRLGVPHRPRARIERNNVSLPQKDE